MGGILSLDPMTNLFDFEIPNAEPLKGVNDTWESVSLNAPSYGYI